MSDATRRISRWMKKCTPERTKATVDLIYEDMARRYADAAAAICTMEDKVKDVLAGAGVPTNMYVSYLDFARELFRLSRQKSIAGESLARAAQVLLEKWAARGCSPDVLRAIRKDTFSIEEPKP